jgi:hypothetical protein
MVSPQEHGEQQATENVQPRAGSRATMDVDAFKNLLMTGKAPTFPIASSTTVPPTKPHFGLQADSSSSTDTSSVSRQSLFETLQEPHTETPRTSYEISISDEDDRSTLIGEGKKLDKPKPPPPKHRHGKAVPPVPPKDSERGPQIVAFDDFTPSFRGPSTKSKLNRLSTDLNKPLPPPPQRGTVDKSVNKADHLAPTKHAEAHISSESQESVTSPKKTPPPPPLSRRYSQMQRSNPVPSRPRSGTAASNISQEETHPRSYPPSIAESTTSSKMAPPPPPARRSGGSSSTSTPQVSTPLNEPTSGGLHRTPSIKSAPTPPSRHRSSSLLSQSSGSAVVSGFISPPPPPPRRTSSRSSQDAPRPSSIHSPSIQPRQTSAEIMRTSGEYDRRISTSSLRREDVIAEMEEQEKDPPLVQEPSTYTAEPTATAANPMQKAERVSSKDILADMEAFQREIEALREQYSEENAR